MIKRRSNWYIYLITFVVTGVIVYIASTALLSSFYESQKGNDTSVPEYTGTVFKPNSSYNFTVLACLSKNLDSAPDYYMTVTYRGDTNSIILMPYLANTYINGSTLKEAYQGGQETAVMQSLSAATGVTIEKYVRFTESTLTEFLNSVGNTTLSIPKELKYENKEDNTLTIVEGGTHSFSGNQFYTYITFPDFGEDDVQYTCKVQATAFCAFINQNFSHVSETTLKGYADYIINFTRCNITEEDYLGKKQALLYTFANVNEPCDYYIPYGEDSGGGFVIAEASFNTVKNMIEG